MKADQKACYSAECLEWRKVEMMAGHWAEWMVGKMDRHLVPMKVAPWEYLLGNLTDSPKAA